jgi:hypothetical protein
MSIPSTLNTSKSDTATIVTTALITVTVSRVPSRSRAKGLVQPAVCEQVLHVIVVDAKNAEASLEARHGRRASLDHSRDLQGIGAGHAKAKAKACELTFAEELIVLFDSGYEAEAPIESLRLEAKMVEQTPDILEVIEVDGVILLLLRGFVVPEVVELHDLEDSLLLAAHGARRRRTIVLAIRTARAG